MIKSFLTIALAAAATLPVAAQAQSAVSLNSDVLVERSQRAPDGTTHVVLEEPAAVVPGDSLVFVLNYQNNGRQPATNFVVTNPLPAAVRYNGTADRAATVSVDQGRTWGQLSALRVRDADGTSRDARAEDVTHVRWAFAQPIPAGETGRLMFRGVVR